MADRLCVSTHVDAEEGIASNLHRALSVFIGEVDLGSIQGCDFKAAPQLVGPLGHGVGKASDSVAVEGRLGDATLSKPKRAVRCHEPFAQQEFHLAVSVGVLCVPGVVVLKHTRHVFGVPNEVRHHWACGELNQVSMRSQQPIQELEGLRRKRVEAAQKELPFCTRRRWERGGFGGRGGDHVDSAGRTPGRKRERSKVSKSSCLTRR